MEKDLTEFEKRSNIKFKDKNLLKEAFVHRSYINENPNLGISHNERLEFLGDAVLELVVTDYLFKTHPESTEGELTAYRAALVNTHSLARLSEKLSVNDHMLLSKGEAKDTGRARQYILANAFEAIVGAIYLDQGYEVAREFIARELFPYLKEIIQNKLWQDNKSYFQERAQEEHAITPVYKIIKETGPDHDRHFIVGVYLSDTLVAEGEGKSKQEAEQEAANNALVKKGWRD